MWVSPSCMLVLLRMLNLFWILLLCPCSAVVLFSAVGTPLFRAVPLTLLPYPTTPSSDRTRPAQLSTHFCSQTEMIVSTQTGKIVLHKNLKRVFLFSLPLLHLWFHSICVSWLYPVLSSFHPFWSLRLHLMVYLACTYVIDYPPPPFFSVLCFPLTWW